MSDKVIFSLVIFSVLTIMYVSYYFSQSMSRTKNFYGIFIGENHRSHEELKHIDRFFKRGITIGYLFIVLFSFSALYFMGDKVVGFLLLIIFVELAFFAGIYFLAYRKVQSFKKEFLTGETNAVQIKTIDTEFLEARMHLKRTFDWLFVLPALITLGTGIYLIMKYPDVPSTIPTHWNIRGHADAFGEKSFGSVFLPLFMQVFMTGILFVTSRSIFAARTRLNPENLEQSRKNALKYLKGLGASNYFFVIFIVGLFALIAKSTVHGTNFPAYVGGSLLILPVIASIMLIYSYIKYGGATVKGNENLGYSPEDEDQYWILGSIYNNPNDPALMVEKRYGVGWTINVGHKIGKLIFIGIFVFLIGVIVFSFMIS